MKIMKRKNGNLSIKLIAILFAMSALHVSAKNPYEFSIHAGGGYSFCSYRLPSNTTFTIGSVEEYLPPQVGLYSVNGVSSSGSGEDLGIGFTGFINPYVGLHVGLGIGLLNVNVTVDSLKTLTSGLNDKEIGKKYDLYSELSGYKEKQRTFSLSIPFMLQFQSIENPSSWRRRTDLKNGFYVRAGFKLNILLGNAYETEVSTLRNTGYFPEEANWAGTQEFAGFGTFKGISTKGNFGFIHAILVLEAGMKWHIADDMFIYTGAYFDYGLNDPAKSNRSSTNDYTSKESLLDFSLLEFAEKTHLMTVGIKVQLAFVR
jgi:hypothetical protein